jgi:hypothetical protein
VKFDKCDAIQCCVLARKFVVENTQNDHKELLDLDKYLLHLHWLLTLLLHYCYTGFTMLLTLLLHYCYTGVTLLLTLLLHCCLHCCYTAAYTAVTLLLTLLLHCSNTAVTLLLRYGTFSIFTGCSRLFLPL